MEQQRLFFKFQILQKKVVVLKLDWVEDTSPRQAGREGKSKIKKIFIFTVDFRVGPAEEESSMAVVFAISYCTATCSNPTILSIYNTQTISSKMGLSLLAFCLLTVFTVTSHAFKFGFPSRFMPQQISQTTSTKGRDTVKLPPVERKLEDISVDQTRQLVDISDSTFCETVLNNEGLTIVLFTR